MNMVHEVEMKMCLESDGASSLTPSHLNTFSPCNSPSTQSFNTHYSLSPLVTEELSSPQYMGSSTFKVLHKIKVVPVVTKV